MFKHLTTTSLLLCCLLVLLPAAVLAAEPAKTNGKPNGSQFRSFTSGISCEAAVKSLEKKEGVSDFALLVSAFVTGTNYVKGRNSQADLKGMMMVTEKYCRDNPKEPITTALMVLDKVLDQKPARENGAPAQSAAPAKAAPAPVKKK
jgi:hypothetical protein